MEGITPEEAAKSFPTDRRSELSGRLYAMHYREAKGSYDSIPDHLVQEAVHAYAEFVDLPTGEKMKLHPLNYVVLPRDFPKSTSSKSVTSRGVLVYEDAAYRVWQMKPHLDQDESSQQ